MKALVPRSHRSQPICIGNNTPQHFVVLVEQDEHDAHNLAPHLACQYLPQKVAARPRCKQTYASLCSLPATVPVAGNYAVTIDCTFVKQQHNKVQPAAAAAGPGYCNAIADSFSTQKEHCTHHAANPILTRVAAPPPWVETNGMLASKHLQPWPKIS
jgi:hypothetical protein